MHVNYLKNQNLLLGVVLFLLLFLFAGCAGIETAERPGVTPLHEAARDGDLEGAKELAEDTALLNARDEKGRTALHYTAANGDLAIAKVLLEAGADLSIVDNNGETAVDYAENNGYEGMKELFLEYEEENQSGLSSGGSFFAQFTRE
jgi:ankyrin repeat protein